MKQNWFSSEYQKTSTTVSRVFNRARTNDGNEDAWLYQANDVGYEYNKRGYYHKREGGLCYLIAYTVSGKAKLSYKGTTYELNPGSLVFINLFEQSLISAEDDNWEIYFIHILGSQAGDFYQSFVKAQSKDVVQNFDGKNFIKYIEEIYSSYMENKDKKIISGLIYLLLLDVIDKVEEKSFHNDVVGKAISILHERYASEISIDELCDELHISKYYFIRIFNKEIGVPPKKYLTNIRIEKARILLVNTNKTIGQIAELSGFKNEENIYYAFKKELNISPDSFRKHIYSPAPMEKR